MFKLETLKANSTKTTALSSVYNYINIYSGAKRFNTSIIHFKLPLNWVSDKSSITLMKWSNGSWISLPTIEISSDLSYKYYEAITDSFSSFVITGNIKQAESATVTVPTIIPTVTEIPFPIVTIAIANQIPTHSTLDVIAVTIISIAIIILLSILIYIKRNSLKEYFKQKFL